jgi:ribonucleotide reductase alpha subunit
VARAVASVEACDREAWERRYIELLDNLRVLPGGRILAGAGTTYNVTLMNCFVMGSLEGTDKLIIKSARTLGKMLFKVLWHIPKTQRRAL